MVDNFVPFRVGKPAFEFEIEEQEVERPYFPYLPALEAGILTSPHDLARPFVRPPIEDFTHATLPNCKQAGLVLVEKDKLMAFDLVAAERRRDGIAVFPASKKAIIKGQIKREGLILAGSDDDLGLVKIAGIVVNTERFWPFVDRMRQAHRVVATVGELTICKCNILDSPVLETKDVDPKTGTEKLVPHNRIFAFR